MFSSPIHKRQWLSIFTILIIGISFSSCISSKNLEEGELLLYKQKIKGNKAVSKGALEDIYIKKTNRKILGGTPYLSAYFFGKKFFNKEKVKTKIARKKEEFTAKKENLPEKNKAKKEARLIRKHEKKLEKLNKKLKEGNWFMRVVGEPPALYDSAEVAETAERMQLFLKDKGFFESLVTYDIKVNNNKKRVNVTYNVTEGNPTFLNEIAFASTNDTIQNLITVNREKSRLKSGDRYDRFKIDDERNRIDKLLKNNGYYEFYRNYVHFNVIFPQADSTIAKGKVNIETVILNPDDNEQHKAFSINTVNFFTDGGNYNKGLRDTTVYNGISYVGFKNEFSERVLNAHLDIHPNDTYSRDRTIESQRQLANLDMFRFVNINFQKDTTDGLLNVNIHTSPLKKYELTNEIGIGVNVSQGIPGPFGTLSFKVRNFFGGLETFQTSIRYLAEVQLTDNNERFFSTEIGATASLKFPQLLIPGKGMFRYSKNDRSTELSAGFTFLNQIQFRRTNLEVTADYNWRRGLFKNFTVTPLDINLTNTTRLDPDFEQFLLDLQQNGNNLIFSFDRSYVSSISGSFIFNNNDFTSNKNGIFLRAFGESGGSTLNFFGNSFFGDENTLFGLRYFVFWKFNTDFRYYLATGKKSKLVFRVNAGAAKPYGRSDILPYEKYYFSGGSSSNRAWLPRRLGPGSFTPPLDDDGTFDYSFEQPGEVILEANIEYRFPVFGRIQGALFTDASNVWMTTDDLSRPGSQFQFGNFFKEFGIGAGLGLRFDFSFLIFRLDAGTKLFDPARPSGQRWIGNKVTLKNLLGEKGQTVFNIGIGYPF